MYLKPFGMCTSGWLQIRRLLLSWFQSLTTSSEQSGRGFYGKLPLRESANFVF